MNYTIKRLDNGDFEAIVSPITELPSKERLEKCVVCSRDTQYTKDTHIDNRKRYVVGAGQLCVDCYDEFNKRDHLF